MEQQSSKRMGSRPSLPPSLWAATARAAPETSALQGDIEANVAVVGGGFTGLRAALAIAESGTSVVVLESGEPGWGASGRNGGQVNPLFNILPAEVIRRVGPAFGSRLIQTVIGSADELFNLVRHYGMACDAEQNGWIQAAHCPAALRVLERRRIAWCEAGADIRLIRNGDLHARIGSTAYDAGILVKRGGSVQPLSYARALAGAAIGAGARLYHGARVDSLRQEGNCWMLRSRKIVIRAESVLLCTNGYTDGLWPGLAQTIVPLISAQGATERLPESALETILVDRATLADTRRVIFYTRKVGRDRLVFGTRGTSDGAASLDDLARIKAGIAQVFPQLRGARLEFCWGGRVAHTTDHMPHLHEPASGLLIGLGYNGRGVAMSTVMGRVLAQRVLGTPTEQLPIPTTPLRSIPLHRFRRLGISAATGWLTLRDELDRRLGNLRYPANRGGRI